MSKYTCPGCYASVDDPAAHWCDLPAWRTRLANGTAILPLEANTVRDFDIAKGVSSFVAWLKVCAIEQGGRDV